jgi:RNA polymerase sigma-70 factor (ECF subfamily)
MPAASPAGPPVFDPQALEAHRPALTRYAMAQLRNHAQAEDAVQETMIAALRGGEGFAGDSSLRTWLTGILKHKIIDILRRASRERPLELDPGEASDADLSVLFQQDGHYVDRPATWGDPDAALEQKKFFAVLELCMEGLPENTARVFAMREIMGRETGEICADLGISQANCWVLLHRARLRLRECLEKNWFAAGGARAGERA